MPFVATCRCNRIQRPNIASRRIAEQAWTVFRRVPFALVFGSRRRRTVMHLSLYVSACGTRLTASLTGPVSYADRRRALDAVCQRGKAQGIDRYLIDFTLALAQSWARRRKKRRSSMRCANETNSPARASPISIAPKATSPNCRRQRPNSASRPACSATAVAAIDWLHLGDPAVGSRPIAFGR